MKKKLLVSTMALAAVAVVVVATEPIASVGVNNTVVANEVSASMSVNPVRVGDTILSGTGVANDNLTIQNLSTSQFYSAVVAADGTWSVPVAAAVEGQKFLVTSNSLPFSNPNKTVPVAVVPAEESKPVVPTPENPTPENPTQEVNASFDVFDVKEGTVVVSGKGAAGESVSVVAQLPDKSTKSYSGVVDADGNWSVTVDAAEAGTTFTAVGSVTQTYASKAVDGVKPQPSEPSVPQTDQELRKSKYLGTHVGELTLHDVRFTSQNLDPNSQKYHDEHERISSIIEKELNSQPGAGSTSIDRGSKEYKDGNKRPAYGEEKKEGPVKKASSSSSKSSSTKASSSKSSSTKASSSAASTSSKSSSADKGSKESKSTEAAVNDAKKAAAKSVVKEGQKVLPNTAAVK